MAKLTLQPFKYEVGKTTEVEYNRWLVQLQAVFEFNKLVPADNPKDCIAVLMSMGGDDIVDTITNKFDKPYDKTWAQIIEVLDKRFKEQNVRLAKVNFITLKQKSNEPVSEYIHRLIPIAKAAKCGDDENIMLQLMVGLDNSENSDNVKKQIIEGKKLDELITWQKGVEGSIQRHNEESVNIVQRQFNQNKRRVDQQASDHRCDKCNRRMQHSARHDCPASNAVCRNCQKKGHYEVCCRSRKQNQPRAQNFQTRGPPAQSSYVQQNNKKNQTRSYNVNEITDHDRECDEFANITN